MSSIFCTNCGAEWDDEDSRVMFYFRPRSDSEGRWSSPKAIADSEVDMTNCPKCPIPRLDAAMLEGDNRRTEGDER